MNELATNTPQTEEKVPGSEPLTNKRWELFAGIYAKIANATQAYLQAYPLCKNKSTARVQACRLLTKPNIADRVNFIAEKSLSHLHCTADRVLQEVVRLAMADPNRMLDKDGKMLNIKDMPEDIRRCISGFDQITKYDSEGNVRSIIQKPRLFNKNAALTDLMRKLNMFASDNAGTGKGLGDSLLELAKLAANRRENNLTDGNDRDT